MSHLLDFSAFEEKLVLLEHFALGSRAYCAARLAGSEQDQGDEQLDLYWSWLKGTVCRGALECAIKFRILCDTAGTGEGIAKIKLLDEEALAGKTIAPHVEGDFPLTLREISNKIIHAVHVVPQWASEGEGPQTFKYWNGLLDLAGTHKGARWALALDVPARAAAMQIFLSKAESNELLLYVGQDWYPKQSAA